MGDAAQGGECPLHSGRFDGPFAVILFNAFNFCVISLDEDLDFRRHRGGWDSGSNWFRSHGNSFRSFVSTDFFLFDECFPSFSLRL
jgi:hypothetical protein